MTHRRILLAEDNSTNRQLALAILEHAGHEVVVATTGSQALELHARGNIEAILMDVQMREPGGLEAAQIIRRSEQSSGRHVRIIAMTAHAMDGEREACLAAGMDAYIAKPLGRDELLAIIDQFPAPAAAAAVRAADAAPCDADRFIERLGGDADLAREMARTFVRQAGRLVDAVRSAVAGGDADALRRAAHALKGAAGNFNAAGTV
ncbi:MAG TPA: response regulator, partial [Gemmatimonadaceae bacterium]